MRLAWVFLCPVIVFGATPEQFLAGMSLEQTVGQLFVVPACPLHSSDHVADLKALIASVPVGGVLVKQSDDRGPGAVLNELQAACGVPLLVMADAEWGLSMTMKGAPVFPMNMTLGAVQDMSLIERMGEEVGREALSVGVQMSLAPVVDVNNNPKNPVIHMRSFGDNPIEVTRRAAAMMRGMKKSGLLTCLKHFPGHGDTHIDSHFGLPVIAHSKERLDAVELVPYRGLQADAVMPAHILFPALDEVPATLSYPVITSLLRGELGFAGLIVTDALNMKALTDRYSVEEVVLQSHAAGADLLLYGNHIFSDVDTLIHDVVPRAYQALLGAYQEGVFPLKRLESSVMRILEAKARFNDFTADTSPNLFTPEAVTLSRELYQAAVTQVGPDFELDPETGYLAISDLDDDVLQAAFCPCICSTWETREHAFELTRLVVSIRGLNPRAKNYGLTDEQILFFKELSSKLEVAYCLFATPYAAALLPEDSTIFIGYEDAAQNAVLKVLTGEEKAVGKLPISFQ